MLTRRSLRLPILLAIVMIALLVVLTVGWVLLSVFGALRSGPRCALFWVLLSLGATFIGMLLAGVVIYLVLSIKAINLNRRQSNFIDSVTHELKSPIASMKLYLQTLHRRQVRSGGAGELLPIHARRPRPAGPPDQPVARRGPPRCQPHRHRRGGHFSRAAAARLRADRLPPLSRADRHGPVRPGALRRAGAARGPGHYLPQPDRQRGQVRGRAAARRSEAADERRPPGPGPHCRQWPRHPPPSPPPDFRPLRAAGPGVGAREARHRPGIVPGPQPRAATSRPHPRPRSPARVGRGLRGAIAGATAALPAAEDELAADRENPAAPPAAEPLVPQE